MGSKRACGGGDLRGRGGEWVGFGFGRGREIEGEKRQKKAGDWGRGWRHFCGARGFFFSFFGICGFAPARAGRGTGCAAWTGSMVGRGPVVVHTVTRVFGRLLRQ